PLDNPLFSLLFGLRSLVMYPCFIYSDETTLKVLRISLKQLQTVLATLHTTSFLVDREQSRHPPGG
ncbi:hypothetical protein NL476_27365, partial [Klebsiella pneumoniae]|nr:hypothetical protein [Klebsiella pneumoniae]